MAMEAQSRPNWTNSKVTQSATQAHACLMCAASVRGPPPFSLEPRDRKFASLGAVLLGRAPTKQYHQGPKRGGTPCNPHSWKAKGAILGRGKVEAVRNKVRCTAAGFPSPGTRAEIVLAHQDGHYLL
eukprot:9633140-Alexandrium_andersonii.AAC.1